MRDAGRFAGVAVAWWVLLGLVHAGLRAVGGAGQPGFLADLTYFSASMLGLAALIAGVHLAGRVFEEESVHWGRLLAVLAVTLVLAGGAWLMVDRVGPSSRAAVDGGRVDGVLEPSALTSTQIRDALRAHVQTNPPSRAVAERQSAEYWPTFNRLAFEHERRRVHVLLIPVMALLGLLAGARAKELRRPWGSVALWALAGYVLLAGFMAGENGFEWIVLRSAGPMEFVAWLQAVVPVSVAVGLGFAALPYVGVLERSS